MSLRTLTGQTAWAGQVTTDDSGKVTTETEGLQVALGIYVLQVVVHTQKLVVQ